MRRIGQDQNPTFRKPINRRDFLKLLSLVPAAQFIPARVRKAVSEDPPNIILLVYDAWAAPNVGLYGYPRDTMPLLSKLAENAVVYHNHYAGGTFTYPGTASLLTGTLSWQHQALYFSQQMDEFFRDNNIYSLLETHHRLTYTHNPIARRVLDEMAGHMDGYLPHYKLFLKTDPIVPQLFGNDYDNASLSWYRSMKTLEEGYANSPFLSRLMGYATQRAFNKIAEDFPHGLPAIEGDNYFMLEDATDWIMHQINQIPQPFFSYFHLLPPHAPYRTRIEYYDRFRNDGNDPPGKPEHLFTQDQSERELIVNRRAYDEYLLYVDQEFDRLYQTLKKDGALENTWIILTSDHGELFERGIKAHTTPALFEPLVKVPLLIFPPGQKKRVDIHTPTSAVDLVPTILDLVGNPAPSWLEGQTLPPFNPDFPKDRAVFNIEARHSEKDKPFSDASVMIRKGQYKLIFSFGTQWVYERLEGAPLYELFDLENDPGEENNLAEKETGLFEALKEELFQALAERGKLP